MKTRLNILLVVALVFLLLLAGCSNTWNKTNSEVENNANSRYTVYYNKKVQYIGNNSEVINLLNILGVGDLGEYTIDLSTDKEPYSLTINYSKLKDNGDEDKFKAISQIDYAFYLLALVDNLSSVDINYKTYNYNLDIEEANKLVEGNIKDYGTSPEKLKELKEILNPQDQDYQNFNKQKKNKDLKNSVDVSTLFYFS